MTSPASAGPWTQDEFMEAVDGLAPVALRVIATLRIADRIACGITTPHVLAAETGTDGRVLDRLLDFLVCRGVFARSPDGHLGLTELSLHLLDNHPGRLRAWLDLDGVGARLDQAVHSLRDAIRTGRPSYPTLFGADFYTDLASAEHDGPRFDELRAAHAADFAREIVHAVDLPTTTAATLVDVGGGAGAHVETLLTTYPKLIAQLVDLPGAVAVASRRMASAGHADRFVPAPGSFFAPLPPAADLYLMVNVLHNWDDDAATTILTRCAQACSDSSRVVTVERPTNRSDPRTTTAMDLRMFLFCGGRERTTAQFTRLATAAGLHPIGERVLPSGLVALTYRPRRGREPAPRPTADEPTASSAER